MFIRVMSAPEPKRCVMPIRPSINAIVSGASALLVLFPAQQAQLRPANSKSDIENMRSDVQRIAGDFNSAMDKLSVQKKQA